MNSLFGVKANSRDYTKTTNYKNNKLQKQSIGFKPGITMLKISIFNSYSKFRFIALPLFISLFINTPTNPIGLYTCTFHLLYNSVGIIRMKRMSS